MYKLGLIGFPLTHSKSPLLFKIFFEIAGISGEYRLFEIPSRRLFYWTASEVFASGFSGINVTVPYKPDAFYFAEKKSDIALRTQSVNLLYFKDSLIIGENTDYFGFSESLKTLDSLKITKKAAVIGAGGSARTILAALIDFGFEKIYITARSIKKAHLLASQYANHSSSEMIVIDPDDKINSELDIVINCTPAGMFPDVDQLPQGFQLLNFVRKGGAAYDLIYNPQKTKFLKEAEKRSLRIKNGWEMLVLQALKTFEIITDIKLDIKIVLRELENN